MGIKDIIGNWVVKNLLIAAALVLGRVLVVSICLSVFTRHGQEIAVPDMTQMSSEAAIQAAADLGLNARVTDSVYVRRAPMGVVFSQRPKPGSKVKSGRKIDLTINAVSPKMVPMPSLVGLSMRQAKAELSSRGLVLGKLMYVSDIATNNVLRQIYGGSEVEEGTLLESGSPVTLVVGLNKDDCVTYPPLVLGMKYQRAMDAIQEGSLNVGRTVFDSTVKDYADSLAAVVWQQRPAGVEPTAVRMGTEVSIWLTLDTSKVPIIEFTEKED